jgi:hypothetical protein
MEAVFPQQLENLTSVYHARHALRLYAALPPAQRQALPRGTVIPVAQLPAAQRPLFLAALQQMNRYRPTLLDLEQWMGGSLSLGGEPYVRIREQYRGSVRYRTEPAPPAAGRAATAPRPGAPRPAAAPESVTRFPVTLVKFQFRYGPEASETVSLIAAPLR